MKKTLIVVAVIGLVIGGLAAAVVMSVKGVKTTTKVAKIAVIEKSVPQPEEVTECQSYHDCNDGFACHRGRCEERVLRIQIQCDPSDDPEEHPLDWDCDGVANSVDNCPFVANVLVPGIGQPDQDRDEVGNACDLCSSEPGPRDNRGCPNECESDNDCDMGLECFSGECSYPCRGALMCPVGMECDSVTDYCEGTPQ